MQTIRVRASRQLSSTRYTLENSPAIVLLVNFAAQNSGIKFRDYYDPCDPNIQARRDGRRAYHAEQRSISADWERFKAALLEASLVGVTDADVIEESRSAFSGRLEWKEKKDDRHTWQGWDYCTGQYFPTEYRKAAATVLEYAIRKVKRERPAQRRGVATIAELKALNEANGGCWFGKGEMKFFGTRIESGIILPHYFISSEQPPHGERRFSIRSFNDEGSIDTVGEFCAYSNATEAKKALREILAQKIEVAA